MQAGFLTYQQTLLTFIIIYLVLLLFVDSDAGFPFLVASYEVSFQNKFKVFKARQLSEKQSRTERPQWLSASSVKNSTSETVGEAVHGWGRGEWAGGSGAFGNLCTSAQFDGNLELLFLKVY